MHRSVLIISTFTNRPEWRTYETRQGKLSSCLPALANLLDILEDVEEVRIMIFAPHCIAEEGELADPIDAIESIREKVRAIVKSSKVEDTPLDRFFRRKMGRTLMSIIRVIPVECLGLHTIEGKKVYFEGNLLWISLRETLEILNELRELAPPRTILLSTTGGLYQLPTMISTMIARSMIPGISTEMEYWNGKDAGRTEMGYLRGMNDLLVMEEIVRSFFEGRAEELIRLLQYLAPHMRDSELGSKVLDQMNFLLGIICGMKGPILPLAHLSILEVISSDLPKISDPADLKMRMKVEKLEKWIVRYRYEASGIEVSPMEALILMILSIAKERLNDLGLVPSRDEFEFKIPGSRKIKLVKMSWDWIEAVVDLMDEMHSIPQLLTLCMQFGDLMNTCRDLLRGMEVAGLNYSDLVERISEEKPLVVMDAYLEGLGDPSLSSEIRKEFLSIIEDPDSIVERIDELRAHAGFLPPLIYLARKHERGIDFLYIRELAEKLLNPDALRGTCGHASDLIRGII